MYDIKYHDTDLSNYSFLVTGGAGFIGSNLVEYLLKYGAKKVRVLDNLSTGSEQNLHAFKDNKAFELVTGDIRDLETCKKALVDIDHVSHQAALGSVPRSINDPVTTNEVNISGFLNMLLASKDAGVKSFVYAASSSTYGDSPTLPKVENIIGDPLSPYAVTKYVNELYAGVFSKVYGFHTVGLRYFNIFGPKQNILGPYAAVIPIFIQAAINDKQVTINGKGDTSRDFTFVENAVQANVKAMLLPGLKKQQVYNIACGGQTTLNEMVDKISRMADRPLKVNYGPERAGDVKHSKASIDKAITELGYQPKMQFDEGLRLTHEWYVAESIK